MSVIRRKFAAAEVLHLTDDGRTPNNQRLPLVIYRGALPLGDSDPAMACEGLFARHGWGAAWRDGIYDYHHFHTTTHEVLGIVAGTARVRFGGENGQSVTLHEGDVVVIPAGIGHRREEASDDLLVVGAYPGGFEFDIGTPREDHAKALAAMRRVPLPAEDPVYGAKGPLLEYWRKG
jgi:uncharacterized protein YjlB